ncbi:MAG: hypothetical protein FJZ63_04160 [Chlamydiae bacterium]|nr:hypothetical protein [Chlamydiota bacterium]
MRIKNFKGQKNYQKYAPPKTIEIVAQEKRQWRFQKEKLPAFLIKVLGTFGFMIAGYLLMNIPGVLVGGLLGYQCIKLLCKIFKFKLS